MRKNSGFGAHNRKFVARSIRAWDADHALRKRSQPTHRPRRRGLVSAVRQTYGLIALALLVGVAALPQLAPAGTPIPGLALFASGESTARRTVIRSFPICAGGKRNNCVVDGDTFWLDGQKIRIADINTPEVSSPKCTAEAELGARATKRLQSLLGAGAFQVDAGSRDEDVFGRKLRTLSRNGQSLGAVLVREGLAHEWHGFKENWCA